MWTMFCIFCGLLWHLLYTTNTAKTQLDMAKARDILVFWKPAIVTVSLLTVAIFLISSSAAEQDSKVPFFYITNQPLSTVFMISGFAMWTRSQLYGNSMEHRSTTTCCNVFSSCGSASFSQDP